MKVTTKVAMGAGLLVGLFMIALVRDMTLVRELASAHRQLSEQRFGAVTATLDVLRTLELSEERLQKLFVTHDEAYAAQLDRLATALDEHLSKLRKLTLPVQERSAVEALAARWNTYRSSFNAKRAELTAPVRLAGREALRNELLASATDVRNQGVSLLSVLQSGISRDVDRSEREARHAESLSWIIAGLAVLSAILFVVLTVRSLNGPLSRLIAATRSVPTGGYAKLAPRGSDELSELARSFDTMVERLNELDQMKRDFLSHVSHELKTPLSAMQETNQLLIEELAGPLTDKQRRFLQLNLDAGRRLSSMLSRLLDLSRLEAGAVAYDVRPVELGELLRTAYHEFEARLREKRITATLTLADAPVLIDADRDWLVQVFGNLLENAIKFSPPDRKLWLQVQAPLSSEQVSELPAPARTLLQSKPGALVTVADEGPGVPEELQERIFERFFQVGKRRVGGGVGLGLAICRDIVAAHGGALWARNRIEGGCVFSVALPLSAVQAPAIASNPEYRSPAVDHEEADRAGHLAPRPRTAERV